MLALSWRREREPSSSEPHLNPHIKDSRPSFTAAELAARQRRAASANKALEGSDGAVSPLHRPGQTQLTPLGRTQAENLRNTQDITTYLRDTWSGATHAVRDFLAEAEKHPFIGQTFNGDDHLVGPSPVWGVKISKHVKLMESTFVPGTSSAAYRAADEWHQDMRAIQGTVHYKAYRYSLLAARLLTGTLSPLQAGIYVGSAALPLIDANFPAASEAARNTIMAASIVADPLGFAAGTAALLAVRLAMGNAAEDRRAFWQCMTFLLTRQLSSQALGTS